MAQLRLRIDKKTAEALLDLPEGTVIHSANIREGKYLVLEVEGLEYGEWEEVDAVYGPIGANGEMFLTGLDPFQDED